LKDGAEMNLISKSTLILAAHELNRNFSYCEYFPAYEIAMDDLRDYRYYKSDMVHPNKQMANYIWEKFSGAYFDAETRQFSRNIQKFISARNHKPSHPQSVQYLDFCKKQIKSIQILQDKYPFLLLKGLIESFKSRL
jgi:hypothetical protein